MHKLLQKILAAGFCTALIVVLLAGQALAEVLSGKVVETLNSGTYTYIQLEKDGEKQWVAIPEALVRVGDEIEVSPGMSMGNYQSPTLGRTFDGIIFSPGIIGARKRVVGNGDDAVASKDEETVAVPKAKGPDAYTIEELFDRREALDGQRAMVSGKIYKVSQFQGMNWLRIVDGTGSRKRGNHKLIVTSKTEAQKDDIITARGTVKANKSLGALVYEVILEDAEVEKQAQ